MMLKLFRMHRGLSFGYYPPARAAKGGGKDDWVTYTLAGANLGIIGFRVGWGYKPTRRLRPSEEGRL